MDMLDGLAGVGAGVENDPVTALSDTLGHRNLMGMRRNGGQQALLSRSEFSQIGVMRPRDDKHVNRRLRIDIAESDSPLIARNYRRRYFGGGYGAKQAVSHAEDLNVCQARSAADIYGCTTANPRCTTPLVQRRRQFPAFRRSGTGHARALLRRQGMWVWGEVQILRQAGPMSKRGPYP
jgi:hypothetical protein